MSDAEESGDVDDVENVRDRMDELRANSNEDPQPTESTGGEDDEPEPRTLTETGLLNDDGDFPWESDTETVVSDGKELERDVFTYVGIPFEVTEPKDPQAFENAADILEGMDDMREPERRKRIKKYHARLADVCLTVDGTPYDEVYAVRRGEEDRRDVITFDVARKYGVVFEDGSVNQEWADEAGATVRPLWDDLNEFQRVKLGNKMHGMTSGESSFRFRFS